GGGAIGFWRILLAHAIRLLLEHTGTPYEDKLYSCGEAPDYDKSQWINEKEKLGLDFPNVWGGVMVWGGTSSLGSICRWGGGGKQA
uniref:GST N-terminal domain-containing protein n=1 Tax=Pavo cristatus TaxID=9049 RepID=A0A8C9FXL6_PAVCR